MTQPTRLDQLKQLMDKTTDLDDQEVLKWAINRLDEQNAEIFKLKKTISMSLLKKLIK
jgi:hypothetical protein